MRYLITSALPYINGVKHLGNIVGSMLPADIYARHLRQRGQEVLYICGTDEHGTPAELAAEAAGMDIRTFCDEMHERQADIYRRFSIDFDCFGRSSSQTNHALTQEVFLALHANGFVQERVVQQFYSHLDKRFLPDRYVIGTCPHCGFQRARGDQCDQCGRLLDPLELQNPRSSISDDDTLELRDTRHVYLKLEALQPEIEKFIEGRSGWPKNVVAIARKWLLEGLRERSISRDLKWGIPVPLAGWEGKVFYVWFDAPLAYISITADWAKRQGDPEGWRRWWQAPDEVQLVQFMAKDNVPFHTVFWPGTMLGTRGPWTMASVIKGYNWLTHEGDKFSTSEQRGVFTDTAVELFSADYWRYALISMAPESDDSDFSFERMATAINKDLADGLGNLASRVAALVQRHFDGRLPAIQGPWTDDEQALQQGLRETTGQYMAAMEEIKLRQAAIALRRMWSLGDEFIARAEPWRTAKSDKALTARTLAMCLHALRVGAVFAYPIIPDAAAAIWTFLGQPGQVGSVAPSPELAQPSDTDWMLGGKPPVFAKITPERCAALTARFGGKPADPAVAPASPQASA